MSEFLFKFVVLPKPQIIFQEIMTFNIFRILQPFILLKPNPLQAKVPILNPLPLTHFKPLVSFYTPWKHQKTFGFIMFSGGIETDQCFEMGQNIWKFSGGIELEFWLEMRSFTLFWKFILFLVKNWHSYIKSCRH